MTPTEQAEQQQRFLAAMPRATRPSTQQSPTGYTPVELAAASTALSRAMGVTDEKAIAEAAARVKEQVPNAVSAASLCSQLVVDCVAVTKTDIEGCLARVRTCTTDTPWASETAPCCHASCAARYRARVAERGGLGKDADAAVTEVIFGVPGVPSCMPGVDASAR
jgi:hypothetical protein